jgi:hypothetical protein
MPATHHARRFVASNALLGFARNGGHSQLAGHGKVDRASLWQRLGIWCTNCRSDRRTVTWGGEVEGPRRTIEAATADLQRLVSVINRCRVDNRVQDERRPLVGVANLGNHTNWLTLSQQDRTMQACGGELVHDGGADSARVVDATLRRDRHELSRRIENALRRCVDTQRLLDAIAYTLDLRNLSRTYPDRPNRRDFAGDVSAPYCWFADSHVLRPEARRQLMLTHESEADDFR